MEPDKPLVTVLGASGFLGAAITATLARASARLRLVSRHPLSTDRCPRGAEVRTADLSDPTALATAVAGSDIVVHLVALHAGTMNWRVADDDHTRQINVGLVENLINELRTGLGSGPPKVCLFAGSTTQAGPPSSGRLDGTERDTPSSHYDTQKLAAEQALMAATAQGVVRGISLRLPVVYGASPGPAGAGRGVVAAMARRALSQTPLTMWHDGAVQRDLLYLDDAARAFATALDHPDELAGRHWVVGTGEGVAVADLFSTISTVVGERTGAAPVPVVSVAPPEGATTMDFTHNVVDSGRYHSVTGWRPRVPLREGVAHTVEALRD